MQLTKIAGVLLALLMVMGTAAAMPGAPAAQADETTDDANETDVDDDANETDDGDESATAAGPPERGADSAERGPPADLPSQVPDFVGDIHDAIGTFLDGDLGGSLGEAISDLTPEDDSADQPDGNESSTPEPTPTAGADA